MKLISTYKVKIKQSNKAFSDTVDMYRKAVDFFVSVVLKEWKTIEVLPNKAKNNYIEKLTLVSKTRLVVKYDFSKKFYKFPSYLRRSAISEAIGKVSSYKSNYANWETLGKKRQVSWSA